MNKAPSAGHHTYRVPILEGLFAASRFSGVGVGETPKAAAAALRVSQFLLIRLKALRIAGVKLKFSTPAKMRPFPPSAPRTHTPWTEASPLCKGEGRQLVRYD